MSHGRLSSASSTTRSHPSTPGDSGNSTPGNPTLSHARAEVPPMHAYRGCATPSPASPDNASHALTALGDPNVTTSAAFASAIASASTAETFSVLYVFSRVTRAPRLSRPSRSVDAAFADAGYKTRAFAESGSSAASVSASALEGVNASRVSAPRAYSPFSAFAVPFPTVAMGTSGSPASRHPLRNTFAASGDVMHTQSQPAASASAAGSASASAPGAVSMSGISSTSMPRTERRSRMSPFLPSSRVSTTRLPAYVVSVAPAAVVVAEPCVAFDARADTPERDRGTRLPKAFPGKRARALAPSALARGASPARIAVENRHAVPEVAKGSGGAERRCVWRGKRRSAIRQLSDDAYPLKRLSR
mmetsp:Transcript_7204/g.29879  ORF Transcript_7204/g.29879 Transcript_7204/m.29879 type:complete len:361 (-) Transcript_7204:1967-3049(-)